ncbi:unnamed protein product [Closterium sp. NIES-54]
MVQISLKPCRLRLDAGHRAWRFILSMYQATDDLYIGQLEEHLTHLRMGELESATDNSNRAGHFLADMRMAGVDYSLASYITHVVKGLPSSYNLTRRLMVVPGTCESLNEDSLTSYIIRDEAIQEAERPTELLPQVKYVASTKQSRQQGNAGSTAEVVAVVGGRRRTLTGRSQHGTTVEAEEVNVGSAGYAATPTTSPTCAPTAKRATTTTREATGSLTAVVIVRQQAAQGEADVEVDTVDQGRRLLYQKQSRRQGGVVLDGRRRRVDHFPGAGGQRGLQGGRSRRAGEPDGGAARQQLFPPSDGNEGGVRRGTVALRGETGKHILVPDVLYVLGVHANLLSAGQLKDNGVKLRDDGVKMLLVSAAGDILGRAKYTGRVLCTNLRPCSQNSRSASADVVALRTIASATKSTTDMWHARLVHVGVDTIKSLAKHEVAVDLNIKQSTATDLPCASCVGGKLAWHTFPKQGTDAENALDVVHIYLCGPFRVAANEGILYFLLLKDRKNRYVWVRLIAKKSDALVVFEKWLKLVERQTLKTVKMLRFDSGGEFLGRAFTDLVEDKGILHNLTRPYAPQQNGMADREMRTVVETVRTMLLHMGVKHHWWHLALRQAKPDLTLVRMWGCMVQFMVPEQQRGGKLAPKARWALHLGVSSESKGWEVLDLIDNKVVTTVEAIFYETMSLEMWKAEHSPISTRKPVAAATNPSSSTTPLLAVEDDDVEDVTPPSAPTSTSPLPLVADLPKMVSPAATGDEGSIAASPSALARGIAGGRRDEIHLGGRVRKPLTTGERRAEEPAEGESAEELSAEEKSAEEPTAEDQLDDGVSSDVVEVLGGEEGELSAGEQSDDSDVVEVPVEELKLRRSTRPNIGKPAEKLSYHACLPLTSYSTLLDNADANVNLPELDPDMHACSPRPAPDAARHEECVPAEQARPRALHSPLMWYKALDDVLTCADWKKSQVDEALYFKVGDDRLTCWVLVYVDDLLAASSSLAMLKELMEDTFELHEISPVEKYLGLEIVRDRPAWKLWLHQQVYVDKLRRRFIDEEQTARVLKTPVSIEAYAELTIDDEGAQSREEEYRQKREVDGCLHYLTDTRDTALEFGGGPESLCLVGYADADDASDKQNWMSMVGYVFFGGAAVSWSSQLIKFATLSSTDSEYVAATEAGKEARRLRFLLAEFQLLDAMKPTMLHVDNQSAMTVTEGLGLKGNLKLVERRYAWL